MADVQVTCITKPDRYSPVEHITHLGGGNRHWTREEAIQAIETRAHTFFVLDPMTGVRANVGVVRPLALLAHAYLQTHSDGVENNNLLSLPECPR